jgi:hypothetical protein
MGSLRFSLAAVLLSSALCAAARLPAQSRPFAMGFAFTPPVLTQEAAVALIPEIARRGEYTIIQREVPWTRILGGISMETVYAEEYGALVDYLRAEGLRIVLLVDPLDGLNRMKEAEETVRNGRTLLDPRLREMHERWVKLLVQRMRPQYVGLASEINTLAAHGRRVLYERIRDMCNTLAPELRRLSPGTKVFVSFQVDDAWGLPPFPRSPVDQFKLLHDFDIDVLGLSSYPVFTFHDPSEIPGDYYLRLAAESGKPVIQVEGGWGSAPSTMASDRGSPQQQAAYLQRLFELLEGVKAELVVSLTYSDLDLADPSWHLPRDRMAILGNFASMGIVDTSLKPKPAFAIWEEQRKRPWLGR